MGIEPTSEAWEVSNSPIPFSSQGDARPLVSVNRWPSKVHLVRPNSNCRLSTVSAHMVNDAAQTDCVANPSVYPQWRTTSGTRELLSTRTTPGYPVFVRTIQ
jgi:hypothetical protein